MPNSKARFVILKIIIALMFAAVAWKLFDLQIMKGDQYAQIATDRLTTNIVEKAPRGEIRYASCVQQGGLFCCHAENRHEGRGA